MLHKRRAMESEVFHCVQIIEQNHTSISTIIYCSSFIPNEAQSTSRVSANNTVHGKHSTLHLLTIELLIVDWIYAEENHKNEVLLSSFIGFKQLTILHFLQL